jgi:hypothetical protein
MLWSEPKTISFYDVQRVLVTVLRDVRCSDWADKVSSASPTSFQSLLGGMGSFTDLVICRGNQHDLASDREPLANELVNCLRSICYAASKTGDLDADAAVASCGTIDPVLTGCRCLACGYGQITSLGARSLIVAVEVRRIIRDGIDQRSPSDALLNLWRGTENSTTIPALIDKARKSGIRSSEGDPWMRPCPGCGSDDTCVYRWRQEHDRFVPADDNLPLRNGQRAEVRKVDTK